MAPSRRRRLRAPLVVTMTAAALAARCDAPGDAPECPSRDRAPADLACPINGQVCDLPPATLQFDGRYCPSGFAIPWRCVEHVWREDATWSCNPPALTDVPPALTDVPPVRDAGAGIDGR